MQTLLNVTKANVWAIIDVARSFLARRMGMSTHDRSSCGMNASDSACTADDEGVAEFRYKRTL